MTCPRCHARSMDESSHAYLLGLYPGDGHIGRGPRTSAWSRSRAPTTGRSHDGSAARAAGRDAHVERVLRASNRMQDDLELFEALAANGKTYEDDVVSRGNSVSTKDVTVGTREATYKRLPFAVTQVFIWKTPDEARGNV